MKSKFPCNLRGSCCCSQRVGCAHIAYDFDPIFLADWQDCFHPAHKQWVVSALGIRSFRELRQRDGSFCQTFEHQIREVSLFDELDGRIDAVSEYPAPAPILTVFIA